MKCETDLTLVSVFLIRSRAGVGGKLGVSPFSSLHPTSTLAAVDRSQVSDTRRHASSTSSMPVPIWLKLALAFS